MSSLSVEIGANTSKLVSEISKAKSSLQAFIGEMNDAADAGEKFTDVSDDQVKSFQKVISQLEKLTEGSMSTKKEQALLTKSISQLKEQWAELGNEARASDFGKAMSDTMRAAKEELDNLKNNISNVDNVKMSGSLKKQLKENTNELINLTAQYRAMSAAEKQSAEGQELVRKMSDIRAKAGELKDTIGDVSDEINVMASDTPNLDVFNQVLGISADAMSTYSSLIAKVTGDEDALKDAIATVMAVQSAANLVTKVTNALQSSSAIMLKARAVQEGAATVAIRLRTAAEGKGVVVTTAATAAQKAFNVVARANPYVLIATAAIAAVSAISYFTKATDDAAKAQKELDDAFKNQTQQLGENIAQVHSLSLEWQQLQTKAEKNQWIEDNKESFKHLGIEIENVDDAENAFNSNTGAIIKSLELRAKAAAYAAVAADKYRKAIEGKEEADSTEFAWYEELYKGLTTQLKQWASGEHVQTFNQIMHKAKGDMYRAAESEAEKALEYLKKSQELKNEASKTLLSSGIKETHKETKEKTPKTPKTTTTSKQDVVVEGSLSDLENKLSDLKKKYKDGIIKITPEDYKKQVSDLELQIVQKKLEMGIDVQFMPGSIAAMEDELSKFKDSYTKGFKPELSKEEYLKQVKELETEIKNKKILMGIEPEIPDGSLKKIDDELSKLQAELNLAISDESRTKIQEEIDKLSGKRREIELKFKAVVDKKSVDDVKKYIEDQKSEAKEEKKYSIPEHQDAATKASGEADELKKELELHKRIKENLEEQYQTIQEKIKAGGILTASESDLAKIYEEAAKQVDNLAKSYDNAAKKARDLKIESELEKKQWEGFKSGVSAIGNLNSGIAGLSRTWGELGKNWNDMTGFEQVTSAIDATVSTLETMIGVYEDVIGIVKLFGEISELTSAKKIASNTAEIASDETKMATETANTQVKIQNDQVENASEIGKLGVKEAGAIAGATASGAALPFPANLAAIAAGIAAVVAAFAMVFSCFAQGGIVGGGSHVGDNQLVRVNAGEMILNGSQQKRLFNLLNGTGYKNNDAPTRGEVKFVINGSDLEGVLKNYGKKVNRV